MPSWSLPGRGPLEHELRAQATASGLGERILFTGFVPDDDLPKIYAAADFSIVPSEALEGFGLTTLESLACGTPVLVTPVGGLPETVASFDRSLILAAMMWRLYRPAWNEAGPATSLAEPMPGVRRDQLRLAGDCPASHGNLHRGGAMILFIDQSGQIGGAELCLADLVTRSPRCAGIAFSATVPSPVICAARKYFG